MTPTTSTLLLRLAIATVFAVAGTAKLRHPASSRIAVSAVGLPDWAARPAVWLLPRTELVIAGAVLVSDGALAAGGAVGLVTALNVGLGLAVLRGTTPTCGCLGRASGRIGALTVVRNGLLAAATVLLYLSSTG